MCIRDRNSEGIRGRKTMIFDISDGVSTVSPTKGKQWKLGQDQVAIYKNNNSLFIRDNKVIIKMRPENERSEITEPFWGFIDKTIGTAESAKKSLKKLMGQDVFDTVKPTDLIKKLIFHVSDKSDSIILDFFSGFRVIIVIEANSYVNIKSSRLLPKFKTQKINSWCAA